MPRTMAFTSMIAGLFFLAISGVLTLELMLPAATAPLSAVLGPAGWGEAAAPLFAVARG